jgi:hypothetical protein
MKTSMSALNSVMELKQSPCSDWPCRVENQILDLVEPACPFRGVVEVHVGMACKPAVVPGLAGVEVVEDGETVTGRTIGFYR